MRILFIATMYWPDAISSALTTTTRCEYLAARGHEVTVCTGFPYYPQWRIREEYRGKIIARDRHNGVTICRSYLYVPSKVATAQRIIHEASFLASSLLRALGQRRPHLVFAVSPPLGLGITGWLLSRLWRVPFIFHVDDLQPDAASDLGMLNGTRFIAMLDKVARFSYRHADLVSTLTPGMRDRIAAKGIAQRKLALFPLWAEKAYFEAPPSDGYEFRRKFRLDGQSLVVHSGNMGVKQGLEVVLDTAALTADRKNLRYLIVGDGATKPALEAQARSENLSNVTFLPVLEKRDHIGLLSAADICLVVQRKSVADILFPSKVPPMFAAGRTVVASLSDRSEVARAIREAGNGLVVEPEHPAALASAVSSMLDDGERRKEMGERGRRYAQAHWESGRQLDAMESQILALASRRVPAGSARADCHSSP